MKDSQTGNFSPRQIDKATENTQENGEIRVTGHNMLPDNTQDYLTGPLLKFEDGYGFISNPMGNVFIHYSQILNMASFRPINTKEYTYQIKYLRCPSQKKPGSYEARGATIISAAPKHQPRQIYTQPPAYPVAGVNQPDEQDNQTESIENILQGTISKLFALSNGRKNGRIVTENGEEFFFYESSLRRYGVDFDYLMVGDKVSFNAAENNSGSFAVNIKPLAAEKPAEPQWIWEEHYSIGKVFDELQDCSPDSFEYCLSCRGKLEMGHDNFAADCAFFLGRAVEDMTSKLIRSKRIPGTGALINQVEKIRALRAADVIEDDFMMEQFISIAHLRNAGAHPNKLLSENEVIKHHSHVVYSLKILKRFFEEAMPSEEDELLRGIYMLEDWQIKALYYLHNVNEQKRPDYFTDRDEKYCRMPLYTFISLCRDFGASEGIISDLHNLRHTAAEELSTRYSDGNMKFLLAEVLYTEKSELLYDITTNVFIKPDIADQIDSFFASQKCRQLLELGSDDKESPQAAKINMQHKTLDALYNSYMRHFGDYTKTDQNSIELNKAISVYFNAIVFDGYNTPDRQEQNLKTVYDLLESVNTHNAYMMLILERKRENGEYLFDLSEHERKDYIMRIAEMDKTEAANFLSFWSRADKFIRYETNRSNIARYCQALIRNGCMGKSIWETFKSNEKNSVTSDILRGIIQKYTGSEYRDNDVIPKKLINVLFNLKKNYLGTIFAIWSSRPDIVSFREDFENWVAGCAQRHFLTENDLIKVAALYNKLSCELPEDLASIIQKRGIQVNQTVNAIPEQAGHVPAARDPYVEIDTERLREYGSADIPVKEVLGDSNMILYENFRSFAEQELTAAYEKFVFQFADAYLSYDINNPMKLKYLQHLQIRHKYFCLNKKDGRKLHENFLFKMLSFLNRYIKSNDKTIVAATVMYDIFIDLKIKYVNEILANPSQKHHQEIAAVLSSALKAEDNTPAYRRYMERLISRLFVYERFIKLPENTQIEIFHYVKPKYDVSTGLNIRLEFDAEFAKFINTACLSADNWNALITPVRVGLALHTDSYGMKFADDEAEKVLENLSRVFDSQGVYSTYRYDVDTMVYHLLERYKDSPALTARLCAVYLARYNNDFENFERRNLNVYDVVIRNPCIRELAYYTACKIKEFYLSLDITKQNTFDKMHKNIPALIVNITDRGQFPDWFGDVYAAPDLQHLRELTENAKQTVPLAVIRDTYWEELIPMFFKSHEGFNAYSERLQGRSDMPEDIVPVLEQRDGELYIVSRGLPFQAWKKLAGSTIPKTQITHCKAFVFSVGEAGQKIEDAVAEPGVVSAPVSEPAYEYRTTSEAFKDYKTRLYDLLIEICESRNLPVSDKIFANLKTLKTNKLINTGLKKSIGDTIVRSIPSEKVCLFHHEIQQNQKTLEQLNDLILTK